MFFLTHCYQHNNYKSHKVDNLISHIECGGRIRRPSSSHTKCPPNLNKHTHKHTRVTRRKTQNSDRNNTLCTEQNACLLAPTRHFCPLIQRSRSGTMYKSGSGGEIFTNSPCGREKRAVAKARQPHPSQTLFRCDSPFRLTLTHTHTRTPTHSIYACINIYTRLRGKRIDAESVRKQIANTQYSRHVHKVRARTRMQSEREAAKSAHRTRRHPSSSVADHRGPRVVRVLPGKNHSIPSRDSKPWSRLGKTGRKTAPAGGEVTIHGYTPMYLVLLCCFCCCCWHEGQAVNVCVAAAHCAPTPMWGDKRKCT